MQWLVIGGSIPAPEVMSRNKFSKVLWPTGQAAYQIVLTAGSNFLHWFRAFLKKATAFRVKRMRQITLNCFYWTSTGAWTGENFPIGMNLAICQSALVIFRCQNTGPPLPVDLKILLSVRILSQKQEILLHLSLVFPSLLAQEKGHVKTRRSSDFNGWSELAPTCSFFSYSFCTTSLVTAPLCFVPEISPFFDRFFKKLRRVLLASLN